MATRKRCFGDPWAKRIIPSVETQRAAAKDIAEFLHGKAVAQTEVMKAEKENEDVMQYQALSDADLADMGLKRYQLGHVARVRAFKS